MKSTTVVAFGVCVLLCLMMGSGTQACTLEEMTPCLNAVTRGMAPTGSCCAKVAAVDVVCFCNLVKNGNYPQSYVNNAVSVPVKCGGDAYAHFKGKICAGHLIK